MKKVIVLFFLASFLFLGSLFLRMFFFVPDLTIVGSVCMADGLGRQSVELMMTLKDRLKMGFVPTTKTEWKDVPPEAKKIIKKKYRKLGKIVLFEDCVSVPEKDHYQILQEKKQEGQIRFAYSMFESTKIPPKWVEVFNEYFDAVIVPDVFHVQVYQNCGVKTPIFILPLGLDLSKFLQEPLKERAHTPFVFGTLGAGISRKNLSLCLDSFAKAFKNNENVQLLIHCRYALPEIEQEVKEKIRFHHLKNVRYQHKRLNKEEYFELFNQIDCYVSLSKGEGFSIQPREAMALGIPVIITDNTAQSTICNSNLVKSVPSTILLPAERRWGGMLKKPEVYGNEFGCTLDDAAKAFQEMYENYAAYLSLSEKARKWASIYDYSSLKKNYFSLLCPKKIFLGDCNEIGVDYLMTNSEELFKKYQKLFPTIFDL